MDELDRNLLSAWERVVARLRSDPAEARKRWRRSRGKMLRRPIRAWCLSLRASDTRFTSRETTCCSPWDTQRRACHNLGITGCDIRKLCEPVRIPWPGVTLGEAAAMLGRHREALRYWLPAGARPGRTRRVRVHKGVRCYDEIREPGNFFTVRYFRATGFGHFGVDVPMVWADRPLNPGASRGESPHALWGSMWQRMGELLPDDYCLIAERVPRYRPYRGGERFRGWDFVCPGRFDPVTGRQRVCGKRVQTLYMPLPMLTIGRWLGDEEGIDVGEGLGENKGKGKGKSAKPQAAEGLRGEGFRRRLSGRWYLGAGDSWEGARSFACSHCWGVRNFSLCDYRGWNEFVSHISGGLLYGKEVDRPGWLAYERKRVLVQRRGRVEQGAGVSGEVGRV